MSAGTIRSPRSIILEMKTLLVYLKKEKTIKGKNDYVSSQSYCLWRTPEKPVTVFLRRAISFLDNRRTLELYLLLLMLSLLASAYNVLFSTRLVSDDLRIKYTVLSVLDKDVQVNQSFNEENYPSLNKTQDTFKKYFSRTSLSKSNSTEEPQKSIHVYEYFINEPDKCQGDVPYLVLLLTVERCQKEARQAIRQTWGQEDFVPGVKILRLFFLGKEAQWTNDTQQDLLKESQEHHDIIQQDYLDTYRNLTVKVLMGLHWVATYCPKASYVMKTDSDMFVNTEYLIKAVLKPEEPPRQNYFTGHLIPNSQPNRNKKSKWYVTLEEYPEKRYPLFCSGTGYVFSVDLASKIVNISPTVRWLHLEDVYVGLCIKKLGIWPKAPPKFGAFNKWKVRYSDCKYNRIVTSHELSPEEIVHYWNKLQQNKHKCGKI
ncbi:beta-1,3-galactosyltransferase 1-like [Hyperolius riggenbachi]|uniref:beta-1,3-galactosyltransferase 1-like n=1 Tax=Hyperolius riggenbachi TaxID=752182 RepID=UPI0035A2E407